MCRKRARTGDGWLRGHDNALESCVPELCLDLTRQVYGVEPTFEVLGTSCSVEVIPGPSLNLLRSLNRVKNFSDVESIGQVLLQIGI